MANHGRGLMVVFAVALAACFPPFERDDDTVDSAPDTAAPDTRPPDTGPPEDTWSGDTATPLPDSAECATGADCAHLDAACVAGDCVEGVCTQRPKAPGSSCDDGLFCTIHDQCDGDATCAGGERVCADGIACSLDTCDDDAGACVFDLTSCACTTQDDCDDDDPCNGIETCGADRKCRPGTPVSCPAATNPCAENVCRSSDGSCAAVPAREGEPCNDGKFCTIDDHCDAGECSGSSRGCADALACSVDACSEVLSLCTHDEDACSCETDAECDDGDACTGVETCGADGKCKPGVPVVCEPSTTACMKSVCGPADGICGLEPDDGVSCSDGDPCTATDLCLAGSCEGTLKSCGDGVACTTDACDGVSGQCVHAPTASCECRLESDCDDGEACNGTETCDPTEFSCRPGVTRDDGAPCQDGKTCTIADRCAAGTCVGDPRPCDDSLACMADACSESAGGCVFDISSCECSGPDDTRCDDGLACNGVETCGTDNTCLSGTPVSCPTATAPCKRSRCRDGDGACELIDDDGAPCDDGDPCTTNDTCFGGSCLAAPVVCDDGVACTLDACAPGSGACTSEPTGACECTVNATCDDEEPCNGEEVCNLTTFACAPGTPLAPGKGCEDGIFCTVGESCVDGVCGGGSPRDCSDGHTCSPDTCDDDAASCVSETVGYCACLDDDECDDGNACNGAETCSPAGGCVAGTPVTCQQPQNLCQQALCDTVTGQCYYKPKPDGGSCSDGNACTVGDACVAGQCNSGTVCPDKKCHAAASGRCEAGTCTYSPVASDSTCTGSYRCCNGSQYHWGCWLGIACHN